MKNLYGFNRYKLEIFNSPSFPNQSSKFISLQVVKWKCFYLEDENKKILHYIFHSLSTLQFYKKLIISFLLFFLIKEISMKIKKKHMLWWKYKFFIKKINFYTIGNKLWNKKIAIYVFKCENEKYTTPQEGNFF